MEKLIEKLRLVAQENNHALYNICLRNAGWAIMWYRRHEGDDFQFNKQKLVVYRYYPTLEEAIQQELLRFSSGEVEETCRDLDGRHKLIHSIIACGNPEKFSEDSVIPDLLIRMTEVEMDMFILSKEGEVVQTTAKEGGVYYGLKIR